MAAGATATTVLPPVKSVMVYRNGDPFYNGRRFVINQRQVATMEAFLNEVTQSIGAPLAVRTLYTPRQGHKVTDLQDLQTGAQYVAAGFEKFKKLDYLSSTGVKKQPAAREETQAKIIQRPNVSAKWRKFIPVPCIVHVFRNGDLLCPPFRFIIPRSMRHDLEQILSLITEKVSLRTGAVRRLCSLEGLTVSSAAELETGHCYVAVGTERFKKLPYVELLVTKASERYYPGKSGMLRRTQNRKAGSGPEDQYSDSALLNSPESDGRRVKSTGDEAAPPQAAQPSRGGEAPDDTSVFFARPFRPRKNRGEPRPPLSNRPAQRSVFKRVTRRRREEVRGAEEVQEDENTATELPVDQRVAEIVEEQLGDPKSPAHSKQERHAQIIKREQNNESERPRKHNGEQVPRSKRDDAERRTMRDAESVTEANGGHSAAQVSEEAEMKPTSSASRPSSPSNAGMQESPPVTAQQNHHHEGPEPDGQSGFIKEVTSS